MSPGVALRHEVALSQVTLGHRRGCFRSSSGSVPEHFDASDKFAGFNLDSWTIGAANSSSFNERSLIGYLPVERELEIKFRASSDVYRYFEVPGEEYAAFMAAESKGSYSRMLMDSLGMMQQLGVVPSA